MSSLAATKPTLAMTLWPPRHEASGLGRLVRAGVLMIAASIFVAAAAQIQVPLWPVPMTGQTLAVLLVGMVLGARLGMGALLLYIGEGALGLPVFSKLSAGLGVLGGPTGGYIVGFALAAGVVGYLAERGWDRYVTLTALAMLIGNVVIYLPGVAWLTLFYAGPGAGFVEQTGASTPLAAAFAAGVLPFVVGDLLKLALAASLMPLAWALIGRRTD